MWHVKCYTNSFYEPPYFDLFEAARVQMNKKTHIIVQY